MPQPNVMQILLLIHFGSVANIVRTLVCIFWSQRLLKMAFSFDKKYIFFLSWALKNSIHRSFQIAPRPWWKAADCCFTYKNQTKLHKGETTRKVKNEVNFFESFFLFSSSFSLQGEFLKVLLPPFEKESPHVWDFHTFWSEGVTFFTVSN